MEPRLRGDDMGRNLKCKTIEILRCAQDDIVAESPLAIEVLIDSSTPLRSARNDGERDASHRSGRNDMGGNLRLEI